MFYSDTLLAKTKTIWQHKCAKIFTDGTGFTHVYPRRSKGDTGHQSEKYLMELQAIPFVIVTDGAGEENGNLW